MVDLKVPQSMSILQTLLLWFGLLKINLELKIYNVNILLVYVYSPNIIFMIRTLKINLELKICNVNFLS